MRIFQLQPVLRLQPSYGRDLIRMASTTIDCLPKGNLINVKGQIMKDADIASLVQGKRVALYFGAGWCPMCRDLETKLPEYTKKFEESGKPVQLIYVSSDGSLPTQLERMEQLKIPMGISADDALSDELKLKYTVWSGREGKSNPVFAGKVRRGGIPAFVALDNVKGEELAYLDTESKSVSALSDWPLDDPSGIF